MDQKLSHNAIVKFATDLANMPELTSFTFENNTIEDEVALCALFNNLSAFERLENLNVRQNKFSQAIIQALCNGVTGKRELRVSFFTDIADCRFRRKPH